MQGFKQAQQEYENKLFDPYGDEYDEYLEDFEESYVERMIDQMREE